MLNYYFQLKLLFINIYKVIKKKFIFRLKKKNDFNDDK